ncbi:MAG: metallophosphoesterase [Planctomycetes bacterium]|nr:metallophosphoesterase [Planctomycetota bacterium]
MKLIVGDIHGCYDELQDLLAKAGLAAGDELIAVGDVVDRGPESPRVLELFRATPGARSILGNHERKHVRSFRGEIKPALSQVLSREQFGGAYPEAVAFMASLPCSLELQEAILVHGFLDPGVPLAGQLEKVLCGTLGGERHIESRCDRPWYELYDGGKPVIVGHRDYLETGRPLIWRDRVFGIDTGCCRGGALTGLLLPGFRIVQVRSRRNYWAEAKLRHRQALRQGEPPDEPLGPEREALICRLHEHLVRENARVLAGLREKDPGFDALSQREQGKAYAAVVGGHPLDGLLHQARLGELSLKALRRRFRHGGSLARHARECRLLDGPAEA